MATYTQVTRRGFTYAVSSTAPLTITSLDEHGNWQTLLTHAGGAGQKHFTALSDEITIESTGMPSITPAFNLPEIPCYEQEEDQEEGDSGGDGLHEGAINALIKDALYETQMQEVRSVEGNSNASGWMIDLDARYVTAGALSHISLPCRSSGYSGVGAQPLYLHVYQQREGAWEYAGVSTEAVQQQVSTTSSWSFDGLALDALPLRLIATAQADDDALHAAQVLGLRTRAIGDESDLSTITSNAHGTSSIKHIADVTLGLQVSRARFATPQDLVVVSESIAEHVDNEPLHVSDSDRTAWDAGGALPEWTQAIEGDAEGISRLVLKPQSAGIVSRHTDMSGADASLLSFDGSVYLTVGGQGVSAVRTLARAGSGFEVSLPEWTRAIQGDSSGISELQLTTSGSGITVLQGGQLKMVVGFNQNNIELGDRTFDSMLLKDSTSDKNLGEI